MTSKTETAVYQPALKTVLAYNKLKLPMFHRAYSWGAPGREEMASSYFMEFLSNRRKYAYFGNLFMYSEARPDFDGSANVDAYLADGQHRLATVVLAGLAVHEALCAISTKPVRNGQAAEAENILAEHAEDFSIFKNSSIEVRVDPGQPAVRLVDFIAGQKLRLAQLASQREWVAADYLAQLQNVGLTHAPGERRTERKNLTLDRNRKFAQIDHDTKQLEDAFVWRAYRSIQRALLEEDCANEFIRCLARCRAFLERLEDYYICMTFLVPRRKGGASLAVLEAQGSATFIQLHTGFYMRMKA